eukprot:TRINITY_DN1244_c0_g1_i1.p1 TRINITY_DN1244_c0_g1~~TRINITY_DN1244_c0_g1_i1.p1  ORF type:complete len:248 (+),score=7.54 TRINITY_DN1244_c0_g1_i1:63-806(+)
MDFNAQEAEGPMEITPKGDTSAIVFLILALILLGFYIVKFFLGCLRLFKLNDPEWIVLEDQDQRIEAKAYNGLLEELAAGENVLYATAYSTSLFKACIASLGCGGGLILLIVVCVPLAMLTDLGSVLFNLSLTACLTGYICAFVYELILSTWVTYYVTAISNKRAINMTVTPAGRFNSPSRNIISSSPLQNLVLVHFETKTIAETKTMGHLIYRDTSSNTEYSLGALVWNPEKIKLLIEQHQTTSSV